MPKEEKGHMRPIVPVQESDDPYWENRKNYTHPAFAQIGVSRISGRRYLYGSDFHHNSYIRIRINGSVLGRDLSHDWPHATERYIEVDLSEAQWATFVSSLNIGEGVQCTLVSRNGVSIPEIPEPTDRREQFSSEAAAYMEKAKNNLVDLRTAINDLKMPEKQKKALLDHLGSVERNIGENLRFVAKSFSEHVERNVEKAKVEVNAYVTQTIGRAGMEAIQRYGALPAIAALSDEDTNQ